MEVFCKFPFERLKIDAEGNATMCCFQQRRCLGNILETGVDEIWRSALSQEIRESTLRDQLHSSCAVSHCPYTCAHTRANTQKRRVVLEGYPITLELDLPIQHCNIGGNNPSEERPACFHCERSRGFRAQTDRLGDICALLRPYMKNLISMHIQGVAEPFWRGRIFEILEDLEFPTHQDHIRVSTTTNGTVFTDPRIARWLKIPKSVITFSIDAATPKTYKLLRRLDAYDEVVRRLTKCCQLKSETQAVHIHNNINLLNINEVAGMVEVAAKAGVDVIDFNPTYGVPQICINQWNVHQFRQAEREIVETSEKLGVRTTFTRKMTLDYYKPECLHLL